MDQFLLKNTLAATPANYPIRPRHILTGGLQEKLVAAIPTLSPNVALFIQLYVGYAQTLVPYPFSRQEDSLPADGWNIGVDSQDDLFMNWYPISYRRGKDLFVKCGFGATRHLDKLRIVGLPLFVQRVDKKHGTDYFPLHFLASFCFAISPNVDAFKSTC